MSKNRFLKSIAVLLLSLLTGCSIPAESNGTENKSTPEPVDTTSQAITTNSPIEATGTSPSETTVTQTVNTAEQGSSEWKLVWSDEFGGPAIDYATWGFERGYIRNNELQYYTDRLENARIENGNLVIEARKEDYNGYKYTSASLNTKGMKSFKYGKIEMRTKLPSGKGMWPAFWTMGDQYGWPACGEIDIMELVGGGSGKDDKIYGTIHWDDNGHQGLGSNVQLETGIFADDYHVFGIEWDSNEIRWYLDGKQYFKADITGDGKSEFHQKHWILLNLAVGGNWPGSPDDTTVFPQKYLIDWVRVYQK